jgi:hypothetical protein
MNSSMGINHRPFSRVDTAIAVSHEAPATTRYMVFLSRQRIIMWNIGSNEHPVADDVEVSQRTLHSS